MCAHGSDVLREGGASRFFRCLVTVDQRVLYRGHPGIHGPADGMVNSLRRGTPGTGFQDRLTDGLSPASWPPAISERGEGITLPSLIVGRVVSLGPEHPVTRVDAGTLVAGVRDYR